MLILLISAGIAGLFGALSATRSDCPPLKPNCDLVEATALDRDIYYWRGALLRPAAISRGNPIGMFVGSVAADSAAAKAKLRPGDILVGLDGMPVGTPRFLALAVADHPSDPAITLRVWRDGAEKQLSLLAPSPDPAGSKGTALGVG